MPTDLDDLLRETGSQWRDRVDAVPSTAPVTPWWRRRWVAVAAAAACLVALIVPVYRSADPVPIAGSGGGAGADCAAPHLSIASRFHHQRAATRHDSEPVPTLHPGQVLTLTGYAYMHGCQEYRHDPAPRPMTVTIYITGHGHSRPLAKATGAGEQGRFTVKVRIPKDFPTGTATLHAGPEGKWSTIKVTIAKPPATAS